MYLANVLKTFTVAAVSAVAISNAAAQDITGAGASFPYPIYAKWAEEYKKVTGKQMNYQSIGSGGGIKQIKAKVVDFGASDMPLKQADLEESGLIQFPAIMGGVVPIVNVEGISPGQMKLDADVVAGIYMGKITKWNAPEIAALNPELKLPASDIVVVRRSDGSGTNFLWTDYLSKSNAEFRNTVGAGTAVKWPTGIGGKGNEGVASNVARLKGAIGYVEYAYAKRNKLSHTQLKNRDGNFVQPDEHSFKAAAAGADWANTPGFEVVLTNQSGKDSWPITGASFILMHKEAANVAKTQEVLKFFDWSFKNGAAMASELDYVSMPDSVITMIEQEWKKSIKGTSGKAAWPAM